MTNSSTGKPHFFIFIIKYCFTEMEMSLEMLVLVTCSMEKLFAVQHAASGLLSGERRNWHEKGEVLIIHSHHYNSFFVNLLKALLLCKTSEASKSLQEGSCQSWATINHYPHHAITSSLDWIASCKFWLWRLVWKFVGSRTETLSGYLSILSFLVQWSYAQFHMNNSLFLLFSG